jgi:uncharacterized OB-fold protein
MGKQGIEGLICQTCGKTFMPPVFTCDQCGSESFTPTLFSGEGEILSFTKVYRGAPGEKTPYVLAVVQLKEGARIATRIKNFDERDPEVGKGVVAWGDYYQNRPLFEIQ